MQVMRQYRKYFLLKVLLLAFAISGHAQNMDIDLLKDIHMRRDKGLDGTMKVLTDAAYPVCMAIPLTQLVAGFATHDSVSIMNGVQTIAGYAVNGIITYALKYGVNRPTPVATYPYLQPYDTDPYHSFPSGHTSFAFSAATSLSICYPHWYVIAPAYLWAAGVGYSRLHLGVHYPTDVLAGAIVGAGSSWLSYKGTRWLQRRKKACLHYLPF